MVYVLPAFDLEKGRDFPLSKGVLADSVAAGKAAYLDKLPCPHCHKFAGKCDTPLYFTVWLALVVKVLSRLLLNNTLHSAGLKKWLKLEEYRGGRLSVFATTSVQFPTNRWEPIFIGKNQEIPLLDERLLSEGGARVSELLESPNGFLLVKGEAAQRSGAVERGGPLMHFKNGNGYGEK